MNRETAAWTKQCGQCLRLLGEDGRYHDLGLTGPVRRFPADMAAENPAIVTPAICPECFEALRACVVEERPGYAVV